MVFLAEMGPVLGTRGRNQMMMMLHLTGLTCHLSVQMTVGRVQIRLALVLGEVCAGKIPECVDILAPALGRSNTVCMCEDRTRCMDHQSRLRSFLPWRGF